jgi:hypothetical protein
VAFRFFPFEQEKPFMEMSEIYLVIAASAIAVTAIYFFFVRKHSAQAKQLQPAHDRHNGQQ